jgi:transposase
MGMNTATPKALNGREWRRQRAWELSQAGWWQKGIAAALGVSRAAVCPWLTCACEGGGVQALRRRPHLGGPAKVTAEQRAPIPALLARGAPADGCGGDVWTAQRIAEVIWRTFGVRSHPDQVSRVLRQAGWSVQRPLQQATRARRGGHHALARGALAGHQKTASDEGATSVWGDESGLYLLLHAARTWAPKGKTPVLQVKLTPDHLARGRSAASRATGTCTGQSAKAPSMRQESSGSCGCSGARPPAHDPRQGARDLGWVAHPPGAPDHGLPGARSGQAATPGAVAWLRAGPEAGRGRWERPDAGGAHEPLLCRSGRAASRPAPSQRAPAAQAPHHPQLLNPLRLLD